MIGNIFQQFLKHFIFKGNRIIADLRYGEKDTHLSFITELTSRVRKGAMESIYTKLALSGSKNVVPGLKLSSYLYLRSAMVRFPFTCSDLLEICISALCVESIFCYTSKKIFIFIL